MDPIGAIARRCRRLSSSDMPQFEPSWRPDGKSLASSNSTTASATRKLSENGVGNECGGLLGGSWTFSNPRPNPQEPTSYMTSAQFGSPRGLVSVLRSEVSDDVLHADGREHRGSVTFLAKELGATGYGEGFGILRDRTALVDRPEDVVARIGQHERPWQAIREACGDTPRFRSRCQELGSACMDCRRIYAFTPIRDSTGKANQPMPPSGQYPW